MATMSNMLDLGAKFATFEELEAALMAYQTGPPGILVLNTQNCPRQRKNSRKFSFGKMFDFARSNIVSTLATFI